MNYELSKRLKEAGFTQPKGTIFGFECDTSEKHKGEQYAFCEDCCYVPTLSELIHACGNHFGELKKSPLRFTDDKRWKASKRFEVLEVEGSTPEEAIANLWLSLQKDKVKT